MKIPHSDHNDLPGMNRVEARQQTRRTTTGVTRVISFTSGKGGTGKTSITINVGLALARMGRSVLILDADLGLANVDVMLGIEPGATIYDVVRGRASIDDIILDGPEGMSIIPAASGIEGIMRLSSVERAGLMHAIERVAYHYDYLLIDTSAGIGSDVMQFNCASREIICIVNPEPTSLTDAYALIKVLSGSYGEKEISVVVNNVRANNMPLKREAQTAFEKLARAVERFLHVELKYVGFIPADSSVIEAVRSQRAMLELFPSSPAGLAVAALARKIDEEFLDYRVKGGMQFFFQQLLEMTEYGGRR